jgi:hypothetical protein
MSKYYNDPSALYLDENQLHHGSTFEHSNVAAQQAVTDAVLTLIPIGGAVRGARAAYYASQGVRRTGFMRGGKWVHRFRTRGGSSRFVKPPARIASRLGESFHSTRHGYRKAHAWINRRLPFPRTRHAVDKLQGRYELLTSPSDFVVRKLAGRLVPGGIYTIAGIKYVASFGTDPTEESSPTDQHFEEVVPPAPISPPRPEPPSSKITPPPTPPTTPSSAKRVRSTPLSPRPAWMNGGTQRRGKGCPPGFYYSFKHGRCMKSKFAR